VVIQLQNCIVRSYLLSDAESLAKYADNKKIWLNLRDGFPNPYSTDDAQKFIQRVIRAKPETNFAICASQEAVGGIGFTLHSDVERISAEIGYWLGEPFWGRGIVTAALKAMTEYAINNYGLKRVYAVPYESNTASFRVLEKAGYALEGRMKKSAIKNGVVLDQLLYSYIVE
jgi:[ribosomal protein S5]-alanine N-acetyltransferase